MEFALSFIGCLSSVMMALCFVAFVFNLKGLGVKIMNLQEAVAGVEEAVLGVGAAVQNVQSSVNEVIADLQNAGASQESIDKLVNAATALGEIASNANTAAQSLRDADPTPATPETPPAE